MKKEDYKSRLKQGILPVSCLVFTYLVFTPLDLVMSNQTYLTFTPKDFALQFVLAGLALSIIGTLVMALFRGKLFRFFLCSVCGLVLATYVQALFLNNNLGTLDGTAIAWGEMKKDMIINGVIWLVLILSQYIASYFLKDTYKTVAFVLALAIAGSQLISCVTLGLTSKGAQKNLYVLDASNQYSVSSKENIIIFSLDYFSKDYLDEIIEEYPETLSEFKDFTYFDNTCGNYGKTYPSLSTLYTGLAYDGTTPAMDYLYNAWHAEKAEKYYGALHEKGYNVNIYADANYSAGYVENMLGKADNVVLTDGIKLEQKLVKGIVKLSLFRTAPLCAKQYFWTSTEDLNGRVYYEGIDTLNLGYDFYTEYQKNGLSVTDEYSIYSWHHLLGAHEPYTTNEVMQLTGAETDPATQARGYLYAINQYMQEMKALGVYDNSTIVITADHGNLAHPFVALMIKLPNEEHDSMHFDHAPTAQNDLMPTVMYALGEDSTYFGETVYEIADDAQRERLFRYAVYDPSYENTNWVGNLGQWNVSDAVGGHFNIFREYRFTGSQDILKDMVTNEEWTAQPLVDSFY